MKILRRTALAACFYLAFLNAAAAEETVLKPPNADVIAVLNGEYEFYGGGLRFIDGKAEKTVVTHGMAQMTAIIREDFPFAWGELNGDEQLDAALLLTEKSEVGKTTGHYLAVSLGGEQRRGTNIVFVGEDVMPQQLVIKDHKVVLRYLGEKNDAGPGMLRERCYQIKEGRLQESGFQATPQDLNVAAKRLSFRSYAALLGLAADALTARLAEMPTADGKDGLNFAKAGIIVSTAEGKVTQIFTQRRDLSFDGLRLGDNISSFKGVFGKPLQESAGEMTFLFKGFSLRVVYDAASGKSLSAYLLPEAVLEKNSVKTGNGVE